MARMCKPVGVSFRTRTRGCRVSHGGSAVSIFLDRKHQIPKRSLCNVTELSATFMFTLSIWLPVSVRPQYSVISIMKHASLNSEKYCTAWFALYPFPAHRLFKHKTSVTSANRETVCSVARNSCPEPSQEPCITIDNSHTQPCAAVERKRF